MLLGYEPGIVCLRLGQTMNANSMSPFCSINNYSPPFAPMVAESKHLKATYSSKELALKLSTALPTMLGHGGEWRGGTRAGSAGDGAALGPESVLCFALHCLSWFPCML